MVLGSTWDFSLGVTQSENLDQRKDGLSGVRMRLKGGSADGLQRRRGPPGTGTEKGPGDQGCHGPALPTPSRLQPGRLACCPPPQQSALSQDHVNH